MLRVFPSTLVLAPLIGCGGPPLEGDLLAIGDSVFAFHAEEERGIANVIGEELGLEVADASVSGAYLTAEEGGDDIREQYQEGDWSWLVMDGGGNDVNDECQCTDCGSNIDSLVSADGQRGALPEFAESVRSAGVRIAFMGYYSVPDNAEFGFHLCNDEVETFRERLVLWAEDDPGILFIDAGDVMTPEDRSLYADDNVHPSVAGSRAIGEHLAAAIAAAE